MKEFWNERYSSEEFSYGTAPNEFFKNEIEKLSPGKILFPAEGEGRNSVFAAKLGWQVTAFDFSEAGREKALDLAGRSGVTIDYQLVGYEDFEAQPEYFDCLVLIFAHPPEGKRSEYYRKLIKYLRPGGSLILEGFAKEQINYSTGGPRNCGTYKVDRCYGCFDY